MRAYGVWGLGLMSLALVGCQGAAAVEEKKPEPKTVVVPAGTPVSLLLIDNLDAGGTKVGRTVGLLVTEDLVVDGEVVIRKGTPVTGEVTLSRPASLANALANRPARLGIRFSETESVTGGVVKLVPFGEDAKPDGSYEFTQKNTAERVDAAKIERLWAEPESREALANLVDRFAQKDGLAGADKDLRAIADQLGLQKTQEVVNQQNQDASGLTMGKAVDAMVEGNLGRLAGADAVLAAQALGELTDLVSSVDHKFRGMFKARTVRANVGTPVPAVVEEGFSVVVR